MKREEEWGAEGEGENEGDETARARRNGGQTASARSQASSRSAAARRCSGDREISCANSCSERPGFKATAPRAKGEGEIASARDLFRYRCSTSAAFAAGGLS